MQFSTLFIAAAALVSAASAQLQFTNTVFNNVTAGKPFTFSWADAKGPVTITLLNGNPQDLQKVSVITSGQTGTSYTWAVPATLAADTYAFEIDDGVSKPNYSVQTQLIGGVTTSSASHSATATPSGSSSSASASATVASSSGFTNSTTSSGSSTSTGTATKSASSSTTHSSTSSSSSTSSPTSAPGGNMAAGLTSNLAFVFLAIGALMTLN